MEFIAEEGSSDIMENKRMSYISVGSIWRDFHEYEWRSSSVTSDILEKLFGSASISASH